MNKNYSCIQLNSEASKITSFELSNFTLQCIAFIKNRIRVWILTPESRVVLLWTSHMPLCLPLVTLMWITIIAFILLYTFITNKNTNNVRSLTIWVLVKSITVYLKYIEKLYLMLIETNLLKTYFGWKIWKTLLLFLLWRINFWTQFKE